ncbi:MAG TPA: chorismate-binding protein, partial [Chryseolinea sp.]|nr:chorismate-binding protein [Chryseolinea sp.]
MKYVLKTFTKKLLADTLTPVNIYLKLRDVFAGSILLESSDYHGHENSLSFICCDPIATFQVVGNDVESRYPDGNITHETLSGTGQVTTMLEAFRNSFEPPKNPTKYVNCGLFGYMAYDSIRFFEDVTITQRDACIPDILYKLYRYVIIVDHFSNELNLFEHCWDGNPSCVSSLDRVEQIILSNRFATYHFALTDKETSNVDDDEFLRIVEKGKEHCYRGDVFQIVLSRRFTTAFKGDEFNVYRSLRSINPSPYLFYFDYGSFKLFG